MSKMNENVAKALAHFERVAVSDEHRAMARMAILMMRDPTEAMIKEGTHFRTSMNVKEIWQAMIDEALDGGPLWTRQDNSNK